LTGLAGAVVSTWDGGAGNWDLDTNWSPVGVPDNDGDTYDVLIDTDALTNSVVSLNMTATIDNLTIDSDDVLNILSSRSLTLVGGVGTGTIANSGLLSLNATVGYTYLRVSGGDVTLSGGGTVTLSNHSYNQELPTVAAAFAVRVSDGVVAEGTNHRSISSKGAHYYTIVARTCKPLFVRCPGTGAGKKFRRSLIGRFWRRTGSPRGRSADAYS